MSNAQMRRNFINRLRVDGTWLLEKEELKIRISGYLQQLLLGPGLLAMKQCFSNGWMRRIE